MTDLTKFMTKNTICAFPLRHMMVINKEIRFIILENKLDLMLNCAHITWVVVHEKDKFFDAAFS